MTTENIARDFSWWQERASQISFDGRAFIDGEFCWALSGKTLPNFSPIDGFKLANVAACDYEDVERAVACARKAFEQKVWSGLPPKERKARMLKLAALIREHQDELALTEVMDMGKPISDALAYDLPETISCYSWYAEAIDKVYDEIAPTGKDALATITREPIGIVAAVVPWNYPLLMSAWKIAPALAAGNCVILKPAEQSPLSALKLAELTVEAGIPRGVFQVLPGLGEEVGQALGLHNDIDCVAFTGSTAVGKLFMGYSGASNLKRIWLECGGKSPMLVFADAPDLDKAALYAALGVFSNQGEVCIASSRLYVEDSIYDDFMAKVEKHAKTLNPGHPLDPESRAGALVDEQHMQSVLGRITRGTEEGAKLRSGGERVATVEGGFYIEPTIFECDSQNYSVVREEIFGPVLTAQRFSSEEHAIQLANDSPYGLGAGLWTGSLPRAHRISRDLRAGLVWINCYFDGDITVPFGGVKQSGFGRDKSLHALDKYSDLKTTWISLAD